METFSCKKLNKSFDGVHALVDISLSFPLSGIVAIIGPNGAGKSTLLNVLTGFLRPESGHCFLGEKDITQLSPYQIARLGVARTFQDLRLILQVSTLENLLLSCPCQRGESLVHAFLRFNVAAEEACNHENARRLLQFVGLEEKTFELAGALSYGQQKLLSLACSLATKAKILFLDEPTAGVHPEMTSRIMDLLQQLQADGKLIIFIEHDIVVVRRIADFVIVMDEGKIIGQGSPNEILERSEIMEAFIA